MNVAKQATTIGTSEIINEEWNREHRENGVDAKLQERMQKL